MPKLIACWGLPASGKSTWSKDYVRKHGDWVRINRDDLRTMFHGRPWGDPDKEHRISATRDDLILHFMHDGVNIIVDETNLHPRSLPALKRIVDTWNKAFDTKYEFVVKRFEISVEKAIERDLQRPVSVGETVIRRMYNNYIDPKQPAPKFNPTLPTAIIVDMDGTLAHFNGRGPYEFEKCSTDTLDDNVAEAVRAAHAQGKTVIVLSGRDDSCYDDTVQWLKDHKVPFDHIWMRATGDKRKDSLVKQEIFDANVRNKFNIAYVIDDRQQVVDMWRKNGLVCWQVAEGNF